MPRPWCVPCKCWLWLLICLVLPISISWSHLSSCCFHSHITCSAIFTHHSHPCVILLFQVHLLFSLPPFFTYLLSSTIGAGSFLPHPVNFLESTFPFPDISMGQLEVQGELPGTVPAPLDTQVQSLLNSFSIPYWPGKITESRVPVSAPALPLSR